MKVLWSWLGEGGEGGLVAELEGGVCVEGGGGDVLVCVLEVSFVELFPLVCHLNASKKKL